MRELSHSLHSFVESIHNDESIYLTSAGKWRVEKSIVGWLRRLFSLDLYAKINLVNAFIACLDNLEGIPINFSKIPGLVVSQKIDFHGYLNAAQSLRESLSRTKNPNLIICLGELKIKTLALLYRLEEENGGLHRTVNSKLSVPFIEMAAEWKKNEKIFWRPELSQTELSHLTHASGYTDFIKILLTDKTRRESFFCWVLRDGLPTDVFIQFPALKSKILLNNMSGRIGRMGEDFLKMQLTDNVGSICLQKVVTLPFEGEEISILDENREIIFKGNYRVKIKHILQVFRNKLTDLGNFEVFAQGVLNWNSNCMGWWNNDIRAYELVDIEAPDWWRQLPVLEVLTIEETGRRFSVDPDGTKWILAAKSARESLNLDYDRCHAYFEMAIPTPDHQYYVIYTFGKAATQLPRNFWHRLFLFGAHVPATIVYPDETMFFTHRQQIGYSFELTEKEGLRLMDAFKEDIQTARTGNMVFQIEAENCGKWIQSHLEEHLGKERVPNLYRFPLLEAEPTGFMAKFFSFFKGLPRFCRNRMFILIHYPLGAWRGRWVVDKQGQKVWKSLINSSFWKDAITYLPAYLHKQHEAGVFAENPDKHKVWVEGSSKSEKKNSEVSPHVIELFEDTI